MRILNGFAIIMAGLVLLAAVATAVSQDSNRGLFDSIMDLIRALLLKLGIGSDLPATTTTTEPCPQPYIFVGNGCCVDANNNGICDSEEMATTTTTTIPRPPSTSISTTTSTTVSTTSTTTTSTTTTLKIRCKVNQDCGETLEERVCWYDGIYSKTTTKICGNPGRPAAFCKEKVIMGITPIVKCVNRCETINGTAECF